MPALLIVLGILLVAYPYISEYLFEHRVDSEINTYQDAVENIGNEEYTQLLKGAIVYNMLLTEVQVQLTDPFTAMDDKIQDIVYEELLTLDDTGIMGYIDIPAISVYLPIYHGTSAEILERGVGHLEGTSLPVGGSSTHSVLTGHTGINKAKMFTDLTELKEGDKFFVHILGDILAYQVYDTSVVLPEDTAELRINADKDEITLVTCTPYGINTHRLFVHGRHIDYNGEEYEQTVQAGTKGTESKWMESYRQAILTGVFITIVFFLVLSLWNHIRKKRDGRKITGITLIIAGILLFLCPEFVQAIQAAQTQELVNAYEEKYGRRDIHVRIGSVDDIETYVMNAKDKDTLYQKMAAYNQSIFENGQSDFTDPWSYEQLPIELNELEDGVFGYIEIPAMNQTFALYVGATMDNMSKGAAIMGQTSLPIGGLNTNCVIAGHRGYNRNKTFFKNIEKLREGDKIYITNPWEKLTYKVEKIDVIEPDNIEAVKIQADRDMITLLTCHPYASHGKYRYLVYCTRCDQNDEVTDASVMKEEDPVSGCIVASDGTIYSSSQSEIKKEILFRKFCIALILLFLLLSFIGRAAVWECRRHTGQRKEKSIEY